jgi:hypothetical protein
MTTPKTLTVACAASLASVCALALPSLAASSHANSHAGTNGGGPPSTHGNSAKGNSSTHSNSGKSHKCKPHSVAFVVGGVLVSQTLKQDEGASTYSGDVTLTVTRTNHHAGEEKPKPGEKVNKTYPLEKVRVTFGLADTNKDGSVGLDDLAANDRVQLLGKVTKLAKKCDKTGFTPKKTYRHIIFNAPQS